MAGLIVSPDGSRLDDLLLEMLRAATQGSGGDLGKWWMEQASAEIERTVPKAIEYGAHDLVEIGRTLGRCMGRTLSEEEMAEMGIYFYLVGKVARWTDAVTRGERPSDDTLFDIGVYIRMAQRVRAAGGWPGMETK